MFKYLNNSNKLAFFNKVCIQTLVCSYLYRVYFFFIQGRLVWVFLGFWNLAIIAILSIPQLFTFSILNIIILCLVVWSIFFFSGPQFLLVFLLEEWSVRFMFSQKPWSWADITNSPYSVKEINRQKTSCPYKNPNAELGGDVSTDLEDGLAGAGDLAEFVFQDMGFWADLSWIYVFARSAVVLAPAFWLGKYVYHQKKDKVLWL